MADLTPRQPYRPLYWPDIIFSLQDMLVDTKQAVYVVGGAVRDALLQRPLTDIDLAVAQGGTALARRIANAFKGDFFVLDAGRDVGRALVKMAEGSFVIDVARFRGDDLLADLTDRDFTINAMAVDLTADVDMLIDPLDGEQDVRSKVIRRCGPQSLPDDPLRALRSVRQSVQLEMRLEPQTAKDVRAARAMLPTISPERLRDEFMKMLAVNRPRVAVRVAENLGLLDSIVPEIAMLRDRPAQGDDYANLWQETLAVVEKMAHLVSAISPHRTDYTGATFGIGMWIMQLDRYRQRLQVHIAQEWPNERSHAALLILAVLLSEESPQEAGARAQALRLSNAERDWLMTVIGSIRAPLQEDDWTPLALHRFWRRTGSAGVDVCLLAAATYLGRAGSALEQDQWLVMVERLLTMLAAYYDQFYEVVEPTPVLDGNQLMAELGLERGPLIGVLLERIREGQVTGDVTSLEDALALARRHLPDTNHHK